MAFDRLIENIIEKQNPTVAGLDPKLDYVPASVKDACFAQYGKTLEGAAAALLAFNKAIIDQICDNLHITGCVGIGVVPPWRHTPPHISAPPTWQARRLTRSARTP